MEIRTARPPFVEFKRIAVPDKKRTEELGRRVTKDVDYAFVMQPGSKDQVERVATDWLAMLKLKVINGAADAYPQEWVDSFHAKYKAFQDGQDAPLDGTSVKEWPVLSPAQAENFIAMRVLTIEDVAGMTEEAMRAYGMGGRELKQKAQEWVKGKDSASVENEMLKKQLAMLTERLSKLEQLGDNEAEPLQVKRGRKPKVVESETTEAQSVE
jgi:hypothetical protein